RLDVADELPDQFIREFRQVMKETDQDSILIGEVWEDASSKVSYAERRGFLRGDELDATTNYPFRQAALDFLLG
ncbi:MAG TPA: alpha-glycosidase, partial [Firmicutes bacterium]|nr:alpha-glycosidase [Bacillota bacterium]